MNVTRRIEIQVDADTAAALGDPRKLAAEVRIIDRLVKPGADDPLITLFDRIAAEAAQAGLTEADIETELAA